MRILNIVIAILVTCTASGLYPELFDLMEETSGAAAAILEDTKLPAYSLSLITDGKTQTHSFSKFTRKLISHSGISLFEVLSPLNVTGLKESFQRMLSKYPHVLIVSDDENILRSTLEVLFREGLLSWSTRLLVVTRLLVNEFQPIRKVLGMTNSVVLTYGDDEAKRYRIYIYVPYSYRPMEIATWTNDAGLQYKIGHALFPMKFDRLQDGAHMDVTAEIYPPLILQKEEHNSKSKDPTKILKGPLIEVLKILTSSINFTCSWTRPTDVAFGYQFPNGSWGGMVGMVAREDVDFSFLIFTVLYSRAQVVDYSIPVTFTYARFLARKGDTEIDPWGFSLPFTQTVWGILVTSFGVVIAVGFTMSLFLPGDDGSPQYKLSNYVRVLLIQDPITPSVDRWSISVLAATWMIAVLIVMASYVGNLKSILTVRHVPQPYHTVKAVVNDPDVRIVTETGGYYHQSIESGFFKELTDAGKQDAMSYVEFTEFEDIVDNQISKGGYVLMNDDLPSKMLIDHHFSKSGSCLFYMSKEFFFPQTSAMIAPKNSPLMPAFNKRLEMVIQSGLYEHWLRREYLNSSTCESAPTRLLIQSSLSFSNVWGTFVVLAVGCMISLVIFSQELCFDKIINSSSNSSDDIES